MKLILNSITITLIAILVIGLLVGLAARRNTICERFVLRPPAGASQAEVARCVEIVQKRIAVLGGEYQLNYGKAEATTDGVIQLSLYSLKGTSGLSERLARRSALELRLAEPAPDPPGKAPTGWELLYQVERRYNLTDLNAITEVRRPFYVKLEPEMVCVSFKAVSFYTTGIMAKPEIQIEFEPEDAERFGEVTGANTGKQLALVIDGEVRSAPEIKAPVTGGRALIGGIATKLEARPLAEILRVGALPFELRVERVEH